MGRTKKVGIAGKYGPRYGVRIRRRLTDIESERVKKRVCPNCEHLSVKRVDSSIWQCSRCDYKYSAGAYIPKVRGFRREEVVSGAAAEDDSKEDKKAKGAKKEAKK
jgi:large subunit ribosomal protein L37Ae